MEASDLNTEEIDIAYDTEEPIVWIDTGDGDRGLGPDAARDLADDFEDLLDRGSAPDTSEHRRLVNTLRQYADKVEDNQ